MLKKPYFMKNSEWFFFDETEFRYVLTDKATKKAKQSYKEYYAELEDGY